MFGDDSYKYTISRSEVANIVREEFEKISEDDMAIINTTETILKCISKYKEWKELIPKLGNEVEYQQNRFSVALEIMEKYGLTNEFQNRCEELNI